MFRSATIVKVNNKHKILENKYYCNAVHCNKHKDKLMTSSLWYHDIDDIIIEQSLVTLVINELCPLNDSLY